MRDSLSYVATLSCDCILAANGKQDEFDSTRNCNSHISSHDKHGLRMRTLKQLRPSALHGKMVEKMGVHPPKRRKDREGQEMSTCSVLDQEI